MLDLGRKDIAMYRNHLIAAAEFNNTSINDTTIIANAFYSGYATFGIPISINLLSNALIKDLIGDEYSISISGQQLPNSLQNPSNSSDEEIEVYASVMLFVFFFFPAVALFVVHPLREALTNVKHLQRMTGVSCFTYWGTMFLFDMVVFLFAIFCIIIGFICMDRALDLRFYESTEIGK